MDEQRTVKRLVETRSTRDGAGVDIRRIAGDDDMDPFLMLDEFGSDDPDDYIAGFPEHPHRGFETVTYMLAGYMEHRDSVGNHGRLGPGDVQWMTAGRGILHSEMPLQENGLMRGFQLWVNLPSGYKMTAPRYQEIASESVPQVQVSGVTVRVIAGEYQGVEGAVKDIVTKPTYLDIHLEDGASATQGLEDGQTALVYVYDGLLAIGGDDRVHVASGHGAVLSDSGPLTLTAVGGAARALLLAGRPLREPVVQYGPFVMNTREEILQALEDVRAGRLTA